MSERKVLCGWPLPRLRGVLSSLAGGVLCLSATACVPPSRGLPDVYVGLPPVPAAANQLASKPRVVPPGPLKLTVRDAELMGLEGNESLSVQRLNPRITKTGEDIQRAVFDPVLSADVSASASRSPAAAGGHTVFHSFAAGLGISKFFPTGTTVDLNVDTTVSSSTGTQRQYATGPTLTVTQALLRGIGVNVNLASLRQAEIDTRSSEYELRGFAETLLADIENTYWDYALAVRQIEIYESSLKLAEQQLSDTNERIRVGVLAETERAAAEANVALQQQGLIDARSSLKTTRLALLRLLNPGGGELWQREVALLDQPVVQNEDLGSVEQHVAVAMRMRPDLNQARLLIRRDDLELVKTKNGLLPVMNLFVTMGGTGYARSFGGSVENLDDRNYSASAGLSFEYALGNRNARAQHERAQLSRRQAADALRNTVQLAEVDVRSAFIEVNRSIEQVAATAASRKLQEETYRAETEKYRVGKSTSFLVAQAQRDLLSAQIAEVQAAVAHIKSLVSLYQLEGSLLERRGISAPGRNPEPSIVPEN